MVHFNFYMKEEMLKELKSKYSAVECSVSALVRRYISEGLERDRKKEAQAEHIRND